VTYGTADLATTGAELTERAECVSAQDIIKHQQCGGKVSDDANAFLSYCAIGHWWY